ncbi:MAG: helix-turn-helix domain-containing protein [Bernardetiaceae bacterium]
MAIQKKPDCPRCQSTSVIKSGFANNRQRYRCKSCNYFFTVLKEGKKIDNYYVVKALQLYLEGLSFREIERLLGVSHVSVSNWVRQYKVHRPDEFDYRPSYRIFTHKELLDFLSSRENIQDAGLVVTPIGDKFMVILWERFRE